MRLNQEQKKKVEENIGLVQKVIVDKVHGPYQFGIYSREDLFQIGCIGLCKAAATDKGGCFSTYAYRLIWHEICDALVCSTNRWNREVVVDVLPEQMVSSSEEQQMLRLALENILKEAKEIVPASTRKGIRALLLMEQGYTSREIGKQMEASPNLVCAWVSKARKYLKGQSGLQQIAAGYGYGRN